MEPDNLEDNAAADDASVTAPKYVLSLDIGTSSVRSHIYDEKCIIKGTSNKKIHMLHPEPGWYEIEPEILLEQVIDCVKQSIKVASITASDITCMGISTMRNTFITWNRTTGQPYHNLITWQDLRARDFVKKWNESYKLKFLHGMAKCLYFFSRSKRHLVASIMQYMSSTIPMRLLWVFDNVENVRADANNDDVMFGTLDTWLLWKLTNEKTYATEYSCASATMLFDSFLMTWSTMACNFVDIPMSILPEIRDTCADYGVCDPEIFGAPIPITAVVADTQASMFGQCCFDVGDVKCTMGTGIFVDCNTGSKPHATMSGLYPVVGWKIGAEVVYHAEGMCSDAGIILQWAESMGYFDNVSETSHLAESVPDSGGVSFVPAFSGLQAPLNDDKAGTGFIGLSLKSTKAHMTRAILESVVFRFILLYETMLREIHVPISQLRVDGGMCNNNFMLQLMADLTDHPIDRSDYTELTSLGAAFLAGLHTGVWSSKEELKSFWKCDRTFEPDSSRWSQYRGVFSDWERAINRFKRWY